MLYSGSVVFALTIVLLVAIAVLRYTIDRRERLEHDLAERWYPVFFHAVEGLPFEAPRIYGRDREIIMLAWIQFTESIRGESRRRLRQLALDLQLESTARKLLTRRNVRLEQLAVVALGRMQSVAAWDQLVALAANPRPVLSLLAARSLLQINPAHAVPILLDGLIRREDWPLVKVAAMLGEVPPEVLSPAMMIALHAVTPQGAPRLLSLLETAHLGDTWPIVAPLLRADQPTEVIVAALKACSDPRAVDPVRSLATHPQWIVRAQAAAALGRIGAAEDRLRLQAMLGDPEWWVRYRAGMALVQLPFVSRRQLTDLCTQLGDRFAADMLRQVLAETAPGVEA
ncbi:MAG: HEAT repeat domain-containing protein [Sulfuritalea sp.]|nr:HEAT repeat domain-containing protein [Sulfuritalea sp.]